MRANVEQTMKAIVYREYGSPDVLRYTDVTRPVAGAGEVLVRVRAAAITHGDLFVMRGSPRVVRLAFGMRRPKRTILGRDIAGVVEAVGPSVTRFKVGDEVAGEMNQLGFAEYVTANQDALSPIPAGVTFEQAATLQVSGTTAWQGMRLAGVRSGQTVLVNGASGGVGTFAVQIAKALGAEVTGVCSTRNVDLVRSIGADHVIDYTREDFTKGTKKVDVIFDLAGNHRISDFRKALVPKGIYVSSSGNGGSVLGPMPRLLAAFAVNPFVSQHLKPLTTKWNADDFAALAQLVVDGKVVPVIERTYPLSETAEAIRTLETQHARGKYVLTV